MPRRRRRLVVLVAAVGALFAYRQRRLATNEGRLGDDGRSGTTGISR